ncbi:MAG TPA: hypothetical protein VGJ22_13105 [Anaerolineales bacterium]|jgi:protein-tyrosine phosphatase
MPSILFVCTGNQYRSPLAAAAFQRKLDQDGKARAWTVASAGTWTSRGLLPFPDALRAAESLGLSLADHTTRPIDAQVLAEHNLIIVMTRAHKESILGEFPDVEHKIHLISEAVDKRVYDIPDPADPDVDLGHVAQQLVEMIDRGYAEICRMGDKTIRRRRERPRL